MPYTSADVKTNPTESEFFTTNEVGNIATGLIREGIQNSLDEYLYRHVKKTEIPANKNYVHVKIFMSGEKYALQPEEYKKYIDILQEHLAAKKNGLRDMPNFDTEAMPYLVFEDFNTNGLVGEPNESKDIEIEDESKKHNFYHFWRNIGITGKPQDKLGRWGIGKTVFPVSSRINTFLGLTIQQDKFKSYLLGQSVLKSHNLVSKPQDYGYRPYGFYAHYKDDIFPYAIDNNNELDEFRKIFKLKRQPEESGLSIVIPFCRQEIDFQSILVAVVLQYYFPIIKKELVVDITHEDETLTINSESLYDIVHNKWQTGDDIPSKESVLRLFDFIKWGLGLGIAEFNALKEQPVKNQPKWSEKLWEGINQEELIEYFEENKRIAFRVPVKYQQVDNITSTKTCWFKVLFEKDEELRTAETHFVRENITIIDIKSIKNPGIRAMVLIDDKDLSNLLGDSENPAHTQWQKDSQNFINKYIHGDKCITYVINSIANIYQKLQKPAAGLEKDVLKNIFYIPAESEPESDGLSDDDSYKDDDIGKPNIPDLPKPQRHMVRIKKIQGGIHVYPSGLTKDNLPEIELQIAYDTTRGNPLKKYQKLDFQLNKAPIKSIQRNCEFSILDTNVIRLKPMNPDFDLTITGFDEKRDLFVNVKTKYPEHDKEV